MAAAELTLNVTEFKAKSLKLFDQLSRGEIGRITVTKRGRPVATVSAAPPDAKLGVEDLYGRLRGTVSIPPGVDITEPVIHPEWEEEMLRDWDEQNR
ncbi:type II toxin-antitoxin system Phd/YefM family antitoxin [uncultured Enterovirga sp.]|uniref:type II toxin-antitoxin system Phd/YefM family antitoxin n=1 Tax=uncultured Enterovirga sp. TaxID=2026352 RepID=UPI0035C99E67